MNVFFKNQLELAILAAMIKLRKRGQGNYFSAKEIIEEIPIDTRDRWLAVDEDDKDWEARIKWLLYKLKSKGFLAQKIDYTFTGDTDEHMRDMLDNLSKYISEINIDGDNVIEVEFGSDDAFDTDVINYEKLILTLEDFNIIYKYLKAKNMLPDWIEG